MSHPCPLCQSLAKPLAHFFCCSDCKLIFKNPSTHLEAAEEKWRYEQHNNSDTPEYRTYLQQLIDPLKTRLAPGAQGLDFGCGPVPMLSTLFEEQGFPTKYFDPFFFDNPIVLKSTYDFITCCEVVEHFYRPDLEFEKLVGLLKPNGWLAVMTQAPPKDFMNWWYHKDPTHVIFFAPETFIWIAKKWNLKYLGFAKGITLLQKVME